MNPDSSLAVLDRPSPAGSEKQSEMSLKGIRRTHYWWLLAALIVGLAVRAPGVLWGANFPTGWYGHHPDEYTHLVNTEMLLDPAATPRWEPNPYPKGLATHVALPITLLREMGVRVYKNPVTPGQIIVTGRVISVAYGVATILIVFLLARRLFRDPRVPYFAAWLVALGGLHVSQSHFFVSDVASIFWYLAGAYCLLLELAAGKKAQSPWLPIGSACLGISFGLKLDVFALPSLALIALIYRPRIFRALQTLAFFVFGVVLVNADSYTLDNLIRTLHGGINSATQIIWWSNALLYLAELPSVVSFPVVVLAAVGGFLLGKRLVGEEQLKGRWQVILVVVIPLFLYLLFLLFKLDQFPRHLVFLIPWISMVAGWSLVRAVDALSARGIHYALVVVPVFAYLLLFVYDGERLYIDEPRNAADRWLITNVAPGTEISWWRKNWIPNYKIAAYPDRGNPSVVIMEMYEVNPFLSGYGLKDSYPSDFRTAFGARSESRLRSVQALFKGETEYREVARFKEGYFMPDYWMIDGLIGNRSRNYIAEVVVFAR